MAWHPETGGANRSEPERASGPAFPCYTRTRAVTDVTSQALCLLRESQYWDVPRMSKTLVSDVEGCPMRAEGRVKSGT
jgi:hypothetical protein